jgi:hypothetical protein
MIESSAHLTCRRLLSNRALAFSESFFPSDTRRDVTTMPTSPPHDLVAHALLLATTVVVDPFAVVASASGSSWPSSLPPAAWAALGAYSFVVVDGLVSPALALAAREATLELVESGALTEYINPMDVGRDPTARHDLRAFLQPTDAEGEDEDDDDDNNTAANEGPRRAAAAAEKGSNGSLCNLRGPLLEVLRTLKQLGRALRADMLLASPDNVQEYQLAYYGAEGQHYECHRDAFPSDGRESLFGQVGRRLTATCYLNEWQPEHEGMLRLHVPVNAEATELLPVDVPPVAGRIVLFLSGAMDHEVLPSRHPRCAFAAWYS